MLRADNSIELRYLDIETSTPYDSYGRRHEAVSIGWADRGGTSGVQVGYGSRLREVRQRVLVPPACHGVVGCDGILNSGEAADRCDVCGGDGSSCEGCIDATAANFDAAARFEDGSCAYDCAVVPAATPFWGGPRTFLPSELVDGTDASLVPANITLGGAAFMDRFGLHTDGSGDYAAIDAGVVAGYADDARFSLSFWFTKTNCTTNLYEYMYSHDSVEGAAPLERDNSNVNVYLSCQAHASLLQTGFVRTVLVDSRDDSADPEPGLTVLFDWPLHAAGNFDAITRRWIQYTLAVEPGAVRTYVDGAPILSYGYHAAWADCIRNPAFPDPTALNTALRAFALHTDALVGGRTDLDPDRHFWGAIAALTIYDDAVGAAGARCHFLAEEAAGAIAVMPEHYIGCTDPLANNHSPWAGIDDGSCTYGVADDCWAYGTMAELGVEWLDLADRDGAFEPALPEDDGTVVVQLPFALGFPYFGRNYTRIAIADNGYVTFAEEGYYFVGETGAAATQTNRMPSAQWPNNQIAVLWTDLVVGQELRGTVTAWGNESVFAIEWAQIPHFDSECMDGLGSGGVGIDEPACLRRTHFELLLFADGSLQMLYQEAPPSPTLFSAISVGWENRWGTVGQDVRYNDAEFPAPNTAVVASAQCFALGQEEAAASHDDSCIYALDGNCDDGTWPGYPNFCPAGTDTTDCTLTRCTTDSDCAEGFRCDASTADACAGDYDEMLNACALNGAGDDCACTATEHVGGCGSGSSACVFVAAVSRTDFCVATEDTQSSSGGGNSESGAGSGDDDSCFWSSDGECDDGSTGGALPVPIRPFPSPWRC